ncbi:probable rRNA-processing protein EBP2 [Amphibalanus amphitrite]|uniref:probable rRNA-processing protein EBP2 n=1 Tax=Amphibalanus amphitrite TaxID=1232801 RepID=UPI001C902A3A|nr:probable rRNA-processing protein EBP2 [Amphibalanus amphitrite]XP_043227832.1 probable rRNA-processing protein EBP2 [Amphibalanus amphitrite]XP_043227833.1 probable rRNA-processing protein EBP2 [Amphibalanus amphitrite]XP_043227835.1 probable rRNA-processing protein EBP2 [Amphibalanus amphitrite]
MDLMDDDSEMEGYHSEDSAQDSDEELQEAFRTGKLQPGLNIVKERPVKTFVNNEGAILAKLEEIRVRLPWLERLDLVNRPAPMAPELKRDQEQIMTDATDDSIAEDDFKREMLFYRQAQASVLEGLPRLQAEGVPTRRPDDYLAQMVKSDEQMDKVRKFLIRQKTQKEMSEKARKLRELKKTGKRTQIEAQQRKQKEKKEMLEKMKKFRKGTEKNLDFLETPEELQSNKRQQPGKARNQKKKLSQKRQEKDARFGFGGRKRGQKRNTAESTSDTSWTSGKSRGGKKFVSKAGGKGRGPAGGAAGGRAKGGRGGGAPNKRPGKLARQNMKNKAKSRK